MRFLRRLPWTDVTALVLLTAPALLAALLAAKLWPLAAVRIVPLTPGSGTASGVLPPDALLFLHRDRGGQEVARLDGSGVPPPFPADHPMRNAELGARGTLVVAQSMRDNRLWAARWLPEQGRFVAAGSVECGDDRVEPQPDHARPMVLYPKAGVWHLWDVGEGDDRPLDFLPPARRPDSVTISPDGRTVALAAGQVARGGHPVTLWDVRTRRPVREVRANVGWHVHAWFTADGQTLVVGGSYEWPVTPSAPIFPYHFVPVDPARPAAKRGDLHGVVETADGLVGLRHPGGERWEAIALDPGGFAAAADRVLLAGLRDGDDRPAVYDTPDDPWARINWRQHGRLADLAGWLKRADVEIELPPPDRCQWVRRDGTASAVVRGRVTFDLPGTGLAVALGAERLGPPALTLHRRAPPDPFLRRLPLALLPAALYLTLRWGWRRGLRLGRRPGQSALRQLPLDPGSLPGTGS